MHLQRWSTAPLLEIRGFLQQLHAISFLSLPISAEFLSSLNMKEAAYLLLLVHLNVPRQWGGTTSLHFICNSSLTIILQFVAARTQKISKHRYINPEHTTKPYSCFVWKLFVKKSSTPTNLGVRRASNPPRM